MKEEGRRPLTHKKNTRNKSSNAVFLPLLCVSVCVSVSSAISDGQDRGILNLLFFLPFFKS